MTEWKRMLEFAAEFDLEAMDHHKLGNKPQEEKCQFAAAALRFAAVVKPSAGFNRDKPKIEVKATDLEMKVLQILSRDIVAYYSHITEWSGLTLAQARRATRSLARKGLAERSIAWNNDDGLVRGSGYILTERGAALVQG